ncbi:hypothetical protein [Nitratidesulfovibrio sp. 1201_IL3209]|uniref:hypothetical protein n=1 Tax=Nitratidesulfovibrio sp. 1201_IL3209 TaxID=3084053 RepID=UPI002FDAF116
MSIGSKFTDGGPNLRASMLVLANVHSVPDNVGCMHFKVPLVVPETRTITASLINNDAEDQWINSTVTGLLVPRVAGQTWHDAFAFLFDVPPAPQVSVTVPPIEVPDVNVVLPSMSGTITLVPQEDA